MNELIMIAILIVMFALQYIISSKGPLIFSFIIPTVFLIVLTICFITNKLSLLMSIITFVIAGLVLVEEGYKGRKAYLKKMKSKDI